MDIKMFFTKEEQSAIVKAIAEAEKETSGEIRVHLESKCKGDVLDRAVQIFKKLKMHDTELRNGVLIYLAVADRKFAILGDVGINKKVPEDFWDKIKKLMSDNFSKNEFLTGITSGIDMIGKHLTEYFPVTADDKNELSDEISFGV
jgi:uncharacterized membrane protein